MARKRQALHLSSRKVIHKTTTEQILLEAMSKQMMDRKVVGNRQPVFTPGKSHSVSFSAQSIIILL